jgi:mRNA interferase RelE/StbE
VVFLYQIIFSKKSEKQLSKLEKDIQKRIVGVLERIKIRPHSYVKNLIGKSFSRLRVGDYRIILSIDNNKLIIFVIELGHRKKIYKNKL